MNVKQFQSFVYILSFVLILLAGCNKDLTEELPKSDYGEILEQDNYELKLDKNKYSNEVDQITLELTNNSASNLNFGLIYYMERYIDGSWYQIPFKDDTEFQTIGIMVKPNESYTQNISTNHLKHDLSSGKYRVVKPISEEITLATEFEVE
ncbi:immunoglobulin-like domain-containing protein [Gracilibacillus saliphilus]|uniref:immunoglobulin-like domain-containing protein n=1 Tax=Gracilibacillus saliphilus TaxID=543890 RepID=UPI0013CF9ADD|nr:immunoglobulin-like domain-containing protein [Gracilibacillus saliphilus]